jgi:hypothetical protein
VPCAMTSPARPQIGVKLRHPKRSVNRCGSRAQKRLAFGSKSSMCVHVLGSRLTGGLPLASIVA